MMAGLIIGMMIGALLGFFFGVLMAGASARSRAEEIRSSGQYPRRDRLQKEEDTILTTGESWWDPDA